MIELEDIRYRLTQVKKLGFIKTHRKGPTGIGKTLEEIEDLDI